jgi:hypothetical protein
MVNDHLEDKHNAVVGLFLQAIIINGMNLLV